MFGWLISRHASRTHPKAQIRRAISMIEALEERRLLSAAAIHDAVADIKHHAAAKHAKLKHENTKASKSANTTAAATATSTTSGTSSTTSSSGSSSTSGTPSDPGQIIDSIEFSLAPSAVQTGLTSLASANSLAAPTSTQLVYLGNRDGVETYTLDYSSTGTTAKITVDQNGNAVTAPTLNTTTWAALDGTGTGSDAAAAAEIAAIAAALNLTAPTSTTTVNVSTTSGGIIAYSVHLTPASSSTSDSGSTGDWDGGPGSPVITVDADGNPIGHQSLPFSVIPTAVQTGINHNLPTGATALAPTSTQTVHVDDVDGVTLYSTSFTTSGTTSTVTVTIAGALATLPAETTDTFSDIPTAAQDELQTLASAEGVTATISAGQAVQVYTEANGTVIYTVTLSGQSVTITLSVDAAGNPTVPPMARGGGCGGDDGQDQGGPGGGDFGAVDFGLASFGGGGFGPAMR